MTDEARKWLGTQHYSKKRVMKKIALILALTCCVHASRLWAQGTPQLINYQGQLLGVNGSPLATGDYSVTFNIYDAAESGNLIWGPQVLDGAGGTGHGPRVAVVDGYFNVMLGPVDTGGRTLTGAFTAATRYLEIKVAANDPIRPRQQILSAPYAMNAANAANAASVLPGGVSTDALANATVTTSKLANAAVTSEKIADGSISVTDLAQEVLNRLVPPGTIVAYAGVGVPPAGWRFCDGSILDATDPVYAALFAVIGKTYGVGNGTSLSFHLPDLRGRTVVGVGQGPGLINRVLAAHLGTETITQVPFHSHPVNITTSTGGAHSHTIQGWSTTGSTRFLDTAPSAATGTYSTSTAGSHNHSVVGQTGNNSGGVPSVDNLQPSIVLNYLIKH